MLLIYGKQATWEAWDEEDYAALMRGHEVLAKELTELGELIDVQSLADPMHTRTVRVHNGVPAITDGPYGESKELLAGYYLVECESLDRAVAIAQRIPDAQYAPVEVRPLMHGTGLEA
jgi:hypothetical protein